MNITIDIDAADVLAMKAAVDATTLLRKSQTVAAYQIGASPSSKLIVKDPKSQVRYFVEYKDTIRRARAVIAQCKAALAEKE